MSYNDKRNEELNNDEMNIKSHLNTSLDLSGISVSEDLINRTLEAIKQQPAQQQDTVKAEEKPAKVIPWNRYVRGFAGVAAAVLLVFVGYNAVKLMDNSKSSKTDSYDTNSAADYDRSAKTKASDQTAVAPSQDELKMATNEADNSAASGAGATTAPEANATQKFTIQDNRTEQADTTVQGTDSSAPASDSQLSIATQPNGTLIHAFRDIIPMAPQDVSSITITNISDGSETTIKDQTAINDFYTGLEGQMFQEGSADTSTETYSIELKPIDPTIGDYTISVGDTVTVSSKVGDQANINSFIPVDYEGLKKVLIEIIQSKQ